MLGKYLRRILVSFVFLFFITCVPTVWADTISPLSIEISYNKTEVAIGEPIEATYTITGGSGKI